MSSKKNYVSYIRVSTKEQGRSGLGLEAQQTIIEHYAHIDEAVILRGFVEVESGSDNNRPILETAVRFCIENDCILVVAKLDRLSRDVEHIFSLMRKLDGRFKSCDLPTTDVLTLSIFAGLAQRERELISIRTRQALQAKKLRGEKLGKIENLTTEGRRLGVAKIKQIAKENQKHRQAKALIDMYRKQDKTFQEIGDILNKSSFTTARGKEFTKAMVRYLWLREDLK
jgi:DNA invertase Pin-like site-specific DNA recombinase